MYEARYKKIAVVVTRLHPMLQWVLTLRRRVYE